MLSASMIERLAHRRVAVFGDSILDSFVVGGCTRLCREAPVPVIVKEEQRDCPGGAANTAANLAALGAHVRLISVIGSDDAGGRLMRALERAGVDTSGVVRSRTKTPHKQRILAGDEYVARIDEGVGEDVDCGLHAAIAEHLARAIAECDVLVISDYALGCVCDETVAPVSMPGSNIRPPVVLDARDLVNASAVGATLVTPNLEEACAATGNAVRTLAAPQEFEELARAVRGLVGSGAVAVTLGGVGVAVASQHESAFIPAPLVGVRHTVGAGDSFTAGVALGLAAGCDLFDAVSLGVLAGSVSVTKPYTAVVTLPELCDTLKSVPTLPSARACR